MKSPLCKKYLLRLLFVLLIAIVLELCVFNFSAFKLTVLHAQTAIDMEAQVEYVNWQQNGTVFITKADPMLILNSVNKEVDNVCISYRTNQDIDQIIVFYTLSDEETFNADNMILIEKANSTQQTININKTVCSIRIDLGEEAGREFTDLQITLNEPQFDIRISRIVTVLAIYCIATFLFSLQRPRVYDVEGDAECGTD